MSRHRAKTFHLLPIAVLTLLVGILAGACANPGSGPDGGPYDETPPRIVSISPPLGQLNTTQKRIVFTFDEGIKIESASEKVVISPPQLQTPDFLVSGKRITVSLVDSLKPNTTYTIDFSDAIVDANESNPLGRFAYYFSTGESLDTMEVGGYVLAAQNLEPVKGILVGLHSDTTDSAFTMKALERVARTDSRGHFSIKGVAPGTYRVYALNDMDGDFKWSRGEALAVLREAVKTASYPDVRYDTIWHDSIRYDTIIPVPFTHYLPDDVVLYSFTEKSTTRYFVKTQRDVPEWFRMYFTAPSTTVPKVTGLNFDAEKELVELRSPGNDTITYWLRDLTIPSVDTLRFAYTYDAFDDSLGHNVTLTDTFSLTPKMTMKRRNKQKEEDMEKWQKELEKRHKRGDYSQETPPPTFISVKARGGARLPLMQNPLITFEEPVMQIDTSAIRLSLKVDTLYLPAPMELVHADGPVMSLTVRGEWRYGQQYRLDVDSAALVGVSGNVNKASKLEFSFGNEEDFGSVFLNLSGCDTTAVVELLVSDNKVERKGRCQSNGRVDFFYVKPGTYYIRAFIDANGNGQWDPGEFASKTPPEKVYYFPQKLEVRANWDIDQTWRVDAVPITRQKPDEITKQKADKEKTTAHEKNVQRLKEKGLQE